MDGAMDVWRISLLSKKTVTRNRTVIYTEQNTWGQSAAISPDDLANVNWTGTGGWDNKIWVPLLASKIITRDGGTYATSYDNYDGYGSPRAITIVFTPKKVEAPSISTSTSMALVDPLARLTART
ncbi:hypothetical protein NKDENANG_03772 [Candidatus Entotheonellaceae bacterium PAL068K]